MVSVVMGVLDHLALVGAQGVAGNDIACVQVADVELAAGLQNAHPGLLPGHGHRVLVGLPGDQAGLVGSTCLVGQRLHASWREVGLQVFSLIPFEAFPGWFAGGSVNTDIGYTLNPVLHVLAYVFLISEDFTVEAILLDVLHAGFHLALALWIVAFAGMDPEPDRDGILVEP